ncbi:hypothetical protein [Nocardioides zhouii]|uniref:Uncharacterized protein n=1 Tax=Nocardioides zhouii TaxID=1168729 RepID=A0A4Q2T6P2_9ACTN|nr:hypothetical protein [Nocardioides zhouii]RYC12628.1 hypothetical protein EUA94_08155 [Nocardioides zhouii]
MPPQTELRIAAPRPAHHLALAGFVVQALVSLVAWFAVDDRPDMRAYSNSDFAEWFTVSLVSSALLAILGGVVLRRSRAVVAVAGGCVLAVTAACVMYVGYVGFNSA